MAMDPVETRMVQTACRAIEQDMLGEARGNSGRSASRAATSAIIGGYYDVPNLDLEKTAHRVNMLLRRRRKRMQPADDSDLPPDKRLRAAVQAWVAGSSVGGSAGGVVAVTDVAAGGSAGGSAAVTDVAVGVS